MDKPKRSLKRIFITWTILLALLYAGGCGLVATFQHKLIFPAAMAGPPGNMLPTTDTERIELITDQGTTVAWFVPAPGSSGDNPAPVVAFFHGNAELIDHQVSIIDLYHRMGLSVLLVEYRGYGHSDGSPSQAHIVEDALVMIDRTLKRDNVMGEQLVLHGRSIGGMLAAVIATDTDPAAVIVESTGTSVARMALRYGVPPFLVRSPLRAEAAFRELTMPILIMHGRNDEIFDASHAKALDAAASDSTLVWFDATHNTLPSGPDVQVYRDEVQALLERSGVVELPKPTP